MDKNSFKQALAQSITPLTPITDFNRQLRCVLDKHAPLCRRTVRQRKPTPGSAALLSSFANWKGNVAGQRGAGWNQNSQCTNRFMKKIKRKVTDLVDNAKTAFYSFKIQTSNSCKELFHNFYAILGKKNSTLLPSDDIPQTSSECFTNKIITIRNSFPPLNPTVAMAKTTYSGKLLRTFTPVIEQYVTVHHEMSRKSPRAVWS